MKITQHDGKTFSWVDYDKDDGSSGVIMSFYSRKGVRINWKAVALHLEPLGEDETRLEWNLGIQNSLIADSEAALRNAVGQIQRREHNSSAAIGTAGLIPQFLPQMISWQQDTTRDGEGW